MQKNIDKSTSEDIIAGTERNGTERNGTEIYAQMSLSDLIQEHKSVFVREVSYDEIKPFILKIHYARRMPCVTHSFGLFKDNELIGVVTYGIPASNSLCRGIAGDKNRYNVYELNRLVILPKYNGSNYASILVGRSLRMMPRRSFIVSYADTGWGHVGYVYQATNWLYTGKTAERTDIYSDGHSRHYEKQEKRRITRTGKHRYVYLVGNKKERKEMMRELRYEVFKEYPKGDSKHYDTKNPKMVKPIEIIGKKDNS